jgi:putative ABC transport system ATP-binding protein
VPDDSAVILFAGVRKVYRLPSGDVLALDGIDFSVAQGEFIAVMGPSGSGKSTLLNLIGCLDTPTEGILAISGNDVSTLSDDALTALRRDHIGFIFQQFNLLPLLSAEENVAFPLIMKCRDRGLCGVRPRELLAAVGLSKGEIAHRPAELSGGQQQRVAIARALANDPEILLADEPTGNLDTKTGDGIMTLLIEMNQRGKTIIMVTHDPHIAAYASRKINLVDGRVV